MRLHSKKWRVPNNPQCWLWRNWHVVTCQKTVWYDPDEKVEFGKKSSNDWKIHNIACLVVYFIEYGKEYNRSFYVVSPWIRQDLILTCIFQFKIEDSAAGWLKNVQMVKLGENLQNSNINRMTPKSSSSEHFCLEQIPAQMNSETQMQVRWKRDNQ